MADQSDLSSKTSQAVGHAQVKKDEMVDKASETFNQGKAQTGGFMQQTGEQVKQMAQGATDAVKNAVGMGGNSSSSITSNTTKP